MPPMTFEGESTSGIHEEKEKFLEKINRGGLCYPSDSVYMTCLHAWKYYHDIQEQEEAFKFLTETSDPVKVFTRSFIEVCSEHEETTMLMSQKCDSGHEFTKSFHRLAVKMFNTFAKNLCSKENSKIHQGKKRPSSSKDERKIKKLQSH